jgi:TolB-like protein
MRTTAIIVFAFIFGVAALAAGAEEKLTIAVLDFDAGVEEVKGLAGTLPDLIEAELAAEKGLRLVTRRDLKKIQNEQSLNLAGLVSAGQGAQVGKLVGAKALVLGRVTVVDSELIITARIIGAETGVFLPAVVRGPLAENVGPLTYKLVLKIRHLLKERGAELLPEPDPVSQEIKKLKKKIKKLGVKLPTVGVLVFEEHVGSTRGVDPAAQTEIQVVFKRLGFSLKEVAGKDRLTGLRAFLRGEAEFAGSIRPNVDILILGEAFSEYAGRVGGLVSAKARLEVRAIRVKDAEILAVFHDSTAAADLAEHFAGKKALEELGRKASVALAMPVAKEGKPPSDGD